jgi:hypothetical protein
MSSSMRTSRRPAVAPVAAGKSECFERHRQLGEHRLQWQAAAGSRHSARMTTLAPNRYAAHRFPPEIISHAVWLYFRFPLSLRMVEEMLAARGIVVSHEAVRHSRLLKNSLASAGGG